MSSTERSRERTAAAVLRVYKLLVAPVLHAVSPSRCIYAPTCSEYAYMAIARFGVMRGGWLALRRIGRCHPWAKGGFDPVPDVENGRGNAAAVTAVTTGRGAGPLDRLP